MVSLYRAFLFYYIKIQSSFEDWNSACTSVHYNHPPNGNYLALQQDTEACVSMSALAVEVVQDKSAVFLQMMPPAISFLFVHKARSDPRASPICSPKIEA